MRDLEGSELDWPSREGSDEKVRESTEFQIFIIKMRFILEVLVIAALLYLGWEKPFRDCPPENVSGVAKANIAATQCRCGLAPTVC